MPSRGSINAPPLLGTVTVNEVGTPVLGASSLTKRVSLRAPEKIGEKVTLTLQLALTPIVVVPHALKAFVKSAGLAPPAEIPEMCSGAAPEFVMVTLMAVLASPCVVTGKFTLVGVIFTAGPLDCCAIPVPTKVTKCGLPEELSVNVNMACRWPPASGVNDSVTVQLLPGAMGVPTQFTDGLEKSAALLPPSAIPEICNAAFGPR
jgi:hypothetical protein